MADDERQEPVFDDPQFRQKRKHGRYRVVDAPQLEGPVADTHAHLQLLSDPSYALARCAAHKVEFVCTIVDAFEDGTATFDRLNYPFPRVPRVRIAVGCHPHNAKFYDDGLEADLRRMLKDPRVAALGEIGLDYHYDFSPRDDQREAFRRQLRLAKEAGLPVVLHLREAHDEALAIMREEGFPEAGTLLHCFTLDWATLEPWVEEGCYVAFGGALPSGSDVLEGGRVHPASAYTCTGPEGMFPRAVGQV